MSPLAPGRSIGRYRILELLGAGAMGEVFLAEDPQIERRLAIKTVRLADARPAEVEERKRRLLREAKAAGRLIHPHVVTLFDAGEADGLLYLAFEYVDGSDLAARLENPPPLTVADVLRIVREAAEGLDFAHHRGIVHRDIKPSNILLDARGAVKVSDFGIAKMVGQASDLTMSGSVVGSPQYLSPEQVRGEDLDGRSDIFSLGVVFYELLRHERPFRGDTLTTIVYQILNHEPTRLGTVRPDLGPHLDELLRRMLAKDRDERWSTAAEVVREIARVEGELASDLLGSPAAAVGGVGEPTANAPTIAAASGPQATSPSAGAAEQPTATPATVAAARGRGRLVLLVAAALVLAMTAGIGLTWVAWHSRGSVPGATRETVGAVTSPATAAGGGDDAEATGPAPPTALPGRSALTPEAASQGGSQPISVAAREGDRVPIAAPAPSPSAATSPHRPASEPPPEPAGPVRPVPAPTAAGPGPARASVLRNGAGGGQAAPQGEVRPAAPASAPDEVVAPAPEAVVDQEVSGGLALAFAVVPEGAFAGVRAADEARFVNIGRAADWSGGRNGAVYTLPGPGDYLVRLSAPGWDDRIVRVHAAAGGAPVTITARLDREAAREIAAGDLRRYRVGSGVALRVTPREATVAVDGRPVGAASTFSGRGAAGSGWLELPPGTYRVSLEAPGYRRRDFVLEIFPGAQPRHDRVAIDLPRAE